MWGEISWEFRLLNTQETFMGCRGIKYECKKYWIHQLIKHLISVIIFSLHFIFHSVLFSAIDSNYGGKLKLGMLRCVNDGIVMMMRAKSWAAQPVYLLPRLSFHHNFGGMQKLNGSYLHVAVLSGVKLAIIVIIPSFPSMIVIFFPMPKCTSSCCSVWWPD